MLFNLEILSLIIGVIILFQYAAIAIISYLRKKSGENGVTKKLFNVSFWLAAVFLADSLFAILFLIGNMGSNNITLLLSIFALITKLMLVKSNFRYYIYIKNKHLKLNL